MTKSTTTYLNTLATENQDRWTPLEGLEGMAEELTLSIDPITGEYTKLTRFLPGTDTSSFGGGKRILTQKKFSSSAAAYTTWRLTYGLNQVITQAVLPVNFMDHSKQM